MITGQMNGTLSRVGVSDCEDKPPCVLKKGTKTVIEMQFKSSKLKYINYVIV